MIHTLIPLLALASAIESPDLRHRWTPAELTAACEAAEVDTNKRLATLVAVPDDKRTFADSFVAFDNAVAEYGNTVWRLSFMKDIHTDAAVRDAASACDERAGKFLVNLYARKDLYQALKAFVAGAGKTVRLDAEAGRLLELTLTDFKRSGLELKDKDREKLVALRSRITELQTRFQKNLNDDKTSFDIAATALVGLPQAFIDARMKKDQPGTVTLTTKYPDYYPVMENAKNEATRRLMETKFMNRGGPNNRKLLDEARQLRAQAAKLLGYKSHVDYVAEDRMAKNAATIDGFLTRMRKGLEPALKTEADKMLALKRTDTKNDKATINAWDWRYYMNQIKQRDFAINDEEVRAYFPADTIMKGMFSVYAELFSITITERKSADVWAKGVSLYDVFDATTKERIAKFYVDMHPREGKYGHAAEFTLTSGQSTEQGYKSPVACLVLNFPAPEGNQPSLLSMDEVKTLFHEFGHVMHESLTTARYASQAGTKTALDFVEAPSQMLENWAYEPEVLARISKDPKDPKKGMPAELAQKLKAARKYNAGVHYSRQLFLGTFDYRIHTQGGTSADTIAKKTWAEVMHMAEDKDAHFAGTFGHMMGGYDGGYYGYLWSEVFAADMYSRFQKEGVMNKAAGRAYRDLVIGRGKSVEATTLLKDFLGRDANEAAFLQSLGVTLTP